jgi:hypothetical protein
MVNMSDTICVTKMMSGSKGTFEHPRNFSWAVVSVSVHYGWAWQHVIGGGQKSFTLRKLGKSQGFLYKVGDRSEATRN